MKNIILFSLFCLFPLLGFGQLNDIVNTDGVQSNVHRTNVGKVVFMDRNIPLEEIKESDFLTSYELNQSSNFNISIFLTNSITNFMHQLAPTLTENELNLKGNYQFSFYVDDTLIYKENIHHGCGLRKSTTTTFRVPFTDTTGADWWSIYLFDRFKNNGGEKALSTGKHKLTVELRPYVKMNEKSEALIGDLIANGSIDLIIKDIEIKNEQIALQAIVKSDDFETSAVHFDQKRIEELKKQIALNTFKAITSIVVIKEGKLLIEEYFNKTNRNTLHDTRSVGKSFTSALMGIAIKDGYIKNELQTINTFYKLDEFENYFFKKKEVNLKDLLTMTSAFDGSDSQGDSPGNEENMYPTDDWVKFTLDLPMDSTKSNGKQWDYFTAGVILLGDILNQSVPGGFEQYAEHKLFKPLNISNYHWQYTPQNVVNTAGGLQMTSLDFAKFGQLYKNNGLWKNQQVIPSEWVKKTCFKYIEIPERKNEYYGFLFWNKTYVINGKNYETFYCAGNGGNKIFIFKDLPLTIVITAKAYNRPYAHHQVDKMMEEYILPALIK